MGSAWSALWAKKKQECPPWEWACEPFHGGLSNTGDSCWAWWKGSPGRLLTIRKGGTSVGNADTEAFPRFEREPDALGGLLGLQVQAWAGQGCHTGRERQAGGSRDDSAKRG